MNLRTFICMFILGICAAANKWSMGLSFLLGFVFCFLDTRWERRQRKGDKS